MKEFLTSERRELLSQFGLAEADLKKPKMLGNPWSDHSIIGANDEFTCAFCETKAVNKVWLGGYTGILVCKNHETLLRLQLRYTFRGEM